MKAKTQKAVLSGQTGRMEEKMAKFTKKKRSAKRRSPYSSAYVEERRKELNELLTQAKTPEDREMLRKAFDVSIRP